MATFVLAMSRPKKDLMLALGLVGNAGEEIYKELYEEASRGRDRLSSDPNALTPYSRQMGVQPPYRWDDLQETYRHRERMVIVAGAVPVTAPYYQRGQHGTVVMDNWVANWFLWHSFRFRDNRAVSGPSVVVPQVYAPASGPAPTGQYWETILQQQRQ